MWCTRGCGQIRGFRHVFEHGTACRLCRWPQEQLVTSPSPSLITGRVWESVGVLWAESGNFIRAIGAYR